MEDLDLSPRRTLKGLLPNEQPQQGNSSPGSQQQNPDAILNQDLKDTTVERNLPELLPKPQIVTQQIVVSRDPPKIEQCHYNYFWF